MELSFIRIPQASRRSFSMVLFLLVLFACALLSGCRRPALPHDILFVALRSDPMYLNPVIASEMSSMTVNSLVFNTLVKYNEKMEIVPDLAESWESSPDGTRWTFRLREGVTWHDGAPFTSEDVRFTFEKLYEPSTNTFNRGLFQVDGKDPVVEAPDSRTIKFTLPAPFSPFFANLTQMGIVPAHVLKGQDINRCAFNWHPVGTGPFRFKEWRSSERIYLEAHKGYFLGCPRLRGMVFSIIPSAESRRIALMTGTVDISNLSTEDLRAVKDMKNITLYQWEQFVYYYVGFDLTKEIFQDVKVRKAINYAIDKEKIVKAVLQGTGRAATGPIPLPSWAYSDRVERYGYDPAKAGRLLDEAGWKKGKDGIRSREGMKLEFKLYYPSGNPLCEKAAVFIQAFLHDAGIKADLRATEFSALINLCNPGQFDAVILDWVENFDPDCYTEWHSSQMGDKGMNFMSYSNPSVDKVLEEARKTADQARRKELYRQFQEKIVEDAPYVFLWNPYGIVAVSNRVRGLTEPGPAGYLIDPEKVYITVE
ncbi:MAG: peptide-binding protein [Candidatus Eremiobacteraeota bacterium]|nr:peptide-binding protein [Candidatus Eremiobacteraeota bacterium]